MENAFADLNFSAPAVFVFPFGGSCMSSLGTPELMATLGNTLL